VITNTSVVASTKQPILIVQLKPLGLIQAFNSTIIPNVQCKRKKCLTMTPKPSMSTTLDINQLKEAAINLDDETSSDDDEDILQSIISLQDKPKRVAALACMNKGWMLNQMVIHPTMMMN
jgi:hypothetical protein